MLIGEDKSCSLEFSQAFVKMLGCVQKILFLFFFVPRNIESNLFEPIQEICSSTKDSKDIFITEIDDGTM